MKGEVERRPRIPLPRGAGERARESPSGQPSRQRLDRDARQQLAHGGGVVGHAAQGDRPGLGLAVAADFDRDAPKGVDLSFTPLWCLSRFL